MAVYACIFMHVYVYIYEYVITQAYKYYCREITNIYVFITGKTAP
jgi:hypothetical protein